MVELIGISEGYEYQHNAKKIENRIYVTRGNSKFAIFFEQTTYSLNWKLVSSSKSIIYERLFKRITIYTISGLFQMCSLYQITEIVFLKSCFPRGNKSCRKNVKLTHRNYGFTFSQRNRLSGNVNTSTIAVRHQNNKEMDDRGHVPFNELAEGYYLLLSFSYESNNNNPPQTSGKLVFLRTHGAIRYSKYSFSK